MSIFYLDYENGNDANDGSTWALAWKTFKSGATAARTAPGDTIRIAKSPDPVDTGYSATFNHRGRISIPSGVCLDVSNCESVWTGGTNVTATRLSTTRTEGTYSAQFVTSAAVTGAQKLGYIALASSTDYSSYQKINFVLRCTTASFITAGLLQIKLCSDTAGNTPVDTINVPALLRANHWSRFVVDTGGALGSAIQSVAIYSTGNFASKTIQIDNIFASLADGSTSVDFYDAVAMNGEDIWWSVGSISNNSIGVAVSFGGQDSASRGWIKGNGDGTSPTANLWKRDTIKMTGATADTMDMQEAGTAGNLITYEFGYNTATSTVDGETFFYGNEEMLASGYSQIRTHNYVHIKNLGCVMMFGLYVYTAGNYGVYENLYSAGTYYAGGTHSNQPITGNTYKIASATGCYYGFGADAYYSPLINHTIEVDYILSCQNIGGIWTDGWQQITMRAYKGDTIYLLNNSAYGFTAQYQRVYSTGYIIEDPMVLTYNDTNGLLISTGDYRFEGKVTVDYSTSASTKTNVRINAGGYASGNIFFKEIESNRGYYGFNAGNGCPSGSHIYISKWTSTGNTYAFNTVMDVNIANASIAEANVILNYTYGNWGRVFIHNWATTAGTHRTYYQWGLAQTDTTTRHTASGTSIKFSPTSASVVTEITPLTYPLGKFKCVSGVEKTISVWMRRDNTGINGTIYLPSGNIAGVTASLTDSITAAADTWEELSVTFTPTEDGYVDLWAFIWGGSAYNLYIDDIDGDTEDLYQWAKPMAFPEPKEHSFTWGG